MPLHRAIGLMSGTSMDGIDVALIETDGEAHVAQGAVGFRPYSDPERRLLRAALADARMLTDASARPGILPQAEAFLTRAHAEAVQTFAKANGIDLAGVDVIGFHGQTVLHRPESQLTVQIGDGAELAALLGRPVVYDLRSADVQAGGQGAPLVPVYHRALVQQARREGRDLPSVVALLNLGGVANATILDGDAEPVACDTGPANALLDDFMLARTGQPFDADGALAASGEVDEVALSALLAHPFFDLAPPKSLDRNAFSSAPVNGLNDADGAATLTAFTAGAVAWLLPHLSQKPGLWIACGGGARNPTLLRMLREALGAKVATAEDFGWSSDAMEAQAFAYLAVRSRLGLPLTFPGTTGVAAAMTGGRLAE
ncbi:MAG: anhydro-N-acetylmuramic acid kinase [Hyphomicrobiales bacterium]|nr:anhydro-N-acetylmuramic acid kinase [Hyphomicrobiales bacterium]